MNSRKEYFRKKYLENKKNKKWVEKRKIRTRKWIEKHPIKHKRYNKFYRQKHVK